MLLRFSVANYLSIREPQELSLAASTLKDVKTGLIDCTVVPSGKVLPLAVIYGANASGKSNVVAALRYLRSAVLLSHSRGDPRGGVPRTPFALDPACAKAPSIFSIDFVVDGVRYQYGFKASDDAFDAEWLYAFPKGPRQKLFERKSKKFEFGRGLKGRNKIISDLTRANSLFLSAAAQNDHEQLSKVVSFFRSLHIDTKFSIGALSASLTLADNEVDNRVIEFLDKIGTGVIDYRRREETTSDDIQVMQREIFSVIEKRIKEPLEVPEAFFVKDVVIELAHRGHDGKPVFFDLDHESAGTRRLLLLLGRIFRVLDEGSVLVIDELDASLHTQACEAVLALFSSPATNTKGAQIIATTHDINLLRAPMLRRDQVWFTEKDDKGATHLYPLTDIRTRKGDNIRKGYQQGRYGAIPFAGPISDLIATG